VIVPRAHFPFALAVSCILLLLLLLASFTVGRFPVGAMDAWHSLWCAMTGRESGLPSTVDAIVMQVRVPRALAALAVGAALSAAGAAYQSLFKNPLVSPDILGATAGCALGAAVAVLMSLPLFAIQAFAFAGGLAAVGLVLAIAAVVRGRDRLLTLVLAGVVIGSLFGAGFMLAVDTVCRSAFATEIPPGVVTAVIGTPVFVVLMAVSFRRSP